ncbi:WD repeat and HMG-box DNA-binding protein 1 [Cephus cinctus]|uniref:WD repeat and HMG-box DNA-binding protein 1 n=1 Tax=Cephus cinctus TaxID=211228 RepID=A0AAJ7CFP6_CEPCN|nr:WD repeat and HMG-box DNA-binding protein 1 [Cephus cinctus]
MPLIVKPTRYAHREGHTDVCYFTGEKGGLITCGADGDVRTWLNLLDDDPAASCIAEQATTVVSKNGKLYVGTDDNKVQILTYPDLEKEGIVTRFSAAISAISTAKNSNLIVSGACDMRIQVTNIKTSDSIELTGHQAPILGLSLDPKEEFVASSSADGSIRVWNIKEKRIVHIWENVVPKCNSFFTAKTYSTPSFHPEDGRVLAYPHGKEIVIIERYTWKELFKLRCSELKTELSICKFSECGTRLAGSSIYGEVAVWDIVNKELIGYVEHQQNAKITALCWSLDKANEIAFCDSLGQLSCIDVIGDSNYSAESISTSVTNDNETADLLLNNDDEDDDNENENVISLDRIKASVNLEGDDNDTDAGSERPPSVTRIIAPEIEVQKPFQPGSSPVHLLSRYMVWNDIGMVRHYTSEDAEEPSIEVEFHDVSVHHSIHINNYLHHTLAALSTQALALACSTDGSLSKIVVVSLQGWGSGNKEWSLDLPEGEQALCLAAGDNFIAVATTTRHIRLYMIGGTQREIIALPGPPVAMNAYQNYLVVAYHTGLGVKKDQSMAMMWIRIRGPNLRSQTLTVPLSPSSELMWLGISDMGSPTIMDAEGFIKMYDKKACLWRVVCDTDTQCKGKLDNFFIIGVSEAEQKVRCVLCRGSHYPPTTPRPTVTEIPLVLPLCDAQSEQAEKEAKLWQLGNDPLGQEQILLSLIAIACRNNMQYRAVDLCQEIASPKIIELAMKYAARLNQMALVKKFESIAESKDQEEKDEVGEIKEDGFDNHHQALIEDSESSILTPVIQKQADVEIRPLPISYRRSNPFLKSGNSPAAKGLRVLDTLPDKTQKPKPTPSPTLKSKPKAAAKKENFVSWYSKHKNDMHEEFPELNTVELTKIALKRYKEVDASPQTSTEKVSDVKKRKLSDTESDLDSQPKRATQNKLSSFTFDK